MTPEARDTIVENVEAAFIAAGSLDYDDGILTVTKLIDWSRKNIELIRTREHLRLLLEQVPDLPLDQEPLAVAVTGFLPQLISGEIMGFATKLFEEFRAPVEGRPKALPGSDLVAVIKYVGAMHLDGYTLAVCKRRAADKFKVSVRTVERAWNDRAGILEGDREISFKEARNWMLKFLESEAGQANPAQLQVVQGRE